ncbi:MAG: O-antigen ligase family protein, partial [Alphaproteobacteria bacterium]
FGHGYGTVWTDESPFSPRAWIVKDANFRPHHAHSSWYEQLLGLGYVGLTAWALFYAQTMTTGVIQAFREKGAFLALPFLVVYSLISLTESITMTYNDLRWVMFVAIACKLAYPDRLQERV